MLFLAQRVVGGAASSTSVCAAIPSSRQRLALVRQQITLRIGNVQSTGRPRSFGIGRMLDMGGMPSAGSDQTLIRTPNASKNSKLQAVAFDFDVLTKSFDDSSKDDDSATSSTTTSNSSSPSSPNKKLGQQLGTVQPDLDQINQVASLLNVDVSGGKDNSTSGEESEDSILSKLLGGGSTTTEKQVPKKKKEQPMSESDKTILSLPNTDVRAKYAKKLNGGLAGLELAKSQLDNTLSGGDAAGHLAVRKMVVEETAVKTGTGTKWMALSGTGNLLSYLTHRSIRIALLPNPKLLQNDDTIKLQEQTDQMKQMGRQLNDVVIDNIVDCTEGSISIQQALQRKVMGELDDNIHPNQVLIVSDSDLYLKEGRDLGMMTCRIRPLNAPRGNVTTHYTATGIPEIQEVINEINGISFNSVLNR